MTGVRVTGHTDLAHRIAAGLGVEPGEPATTVVDVALGWQPSYELDLLTRIRHSRAVLLPVRVITDLAVVGPWVRPGVPGCHLCAERRRRLVVRRDHPGMPVDGPLPALPLAPGLAEVLAAVVGAALHDDLLGPDQVFVCDGDLSSGIHRTTPLATCAGCGAIEDDSAARAGIGLLPRPQPDPGAFRCDPAMTDAPRVLDRLLDSRYGPVTRLVRDEQAPVAFVSAEVASPGGAADVAGQGRADRFETGTRIAVLEAAERLASAVPCRVRTVVHAAFAELTDAVDPCLLGLPEPHPKSRCDPYTPDTPTTWVWGWRPRSATAVLVPEHAAYWDTGRSAPRFLLESSSGSAAGAVIEEAVLYGLLEVAERDAFLTTWYARTPAAPLLVTDDEVPGLGRLRAVLDDLGYALRLFDVTNDIGVPVVLAKVVLRSPRNAPAAFFATGAHLDPRRAVLAAAGEAVTTAALTARRADEWAAEADRARRLLVDHDGVATMRDHQLLHTLPEAAPLHDFLDGGVEPRSLDVFGDWRATWQRDDLTDVLRLLLDRFGAIGLDPIVVNQTDPGTGVPTVKVIVPQTVPLTFGHVHRRVLGLRRLVVDPAAPVPHPIC